MRDEVYYFNINDYKIRKQKKRTILISKVEFSIMILNDTGYLILSLMNGEKTIKEIIDEVIAKYDISEKSAEQYTIKFINEMIEKGVIVKKEDYVIKQNFDQCLNRVFLDLSKANDKDSKYSYEFVANLVDRIEQEHREEFVRFYINVGDCKLTDELKKILVHIGEKEYTRVFLFTDGYWIANEFLEEYRDMVQVLVLNLYRYDRKVDLDQICEKNQLCKKFDKYFFVNVVLEDDNLESCLTLQQDLQENKINGFFLDDSNIKKYDVYKSFLEKLYFKNNFLNSWKNNRLTGVDNKIILMTEKELCLRNFYSHKAKRHCGLGIEEIYVDSDMNIYPCHKSSRTDIHFTEIDEYFEKKEELFGDNLINEKCKDCDAWSLCMGGCKMNNIKEGGRWEDVPVDCDDLYKTIDDYFMKL